MPTPVWITDRNLVAATRHLVEAIEASGARLFQTQYVPFAPEQDFGPFTNQDCCVIYGTANLIEAIPEEMRGFAYGVTPAIGPEHYYAHLPSEWMLNGDFVILPLGLIPARLGEGRHFIRPLNPFKTFAGGVVDGAEDLRALLGHGQVSPSTLCLLASAKAIGREFRFVVVDGAVVAQGSYGRQPKATPTEEAACRTLAEMVAAGAWQPDRVYMCDVAWTDRGPRIVELNAFACAGLYDCDVAAVVEAVNRVALDDHARRQAGDRFADASREARRSVPASVDLGL